MPDAVNEEEVILCCAVCCANCSIYPACDAFGVSGKVRVNFGTNWKLSAFSSLVVVTCCLHVFSVLLAFVSSKRLVSAAVIWNAAASQVLLAFFLSAAWGSRLNVTVAPLSMHKCRFVVWSSARRCHATKKFRLQYQFLV